jgi:hypothetical protein
VNVRVIAPLCDENANTAYDMPAIEMLMIVADGAQAYLGSVNLSVASMTDARELGILVSDPTTMTTIQMLTSSFERDWAQAVSAIPATPNCPAVSE